MAEEHPSGEIRGPLQGRWYYTKHLEIDGGNAVLLFDKCWLSSTSQTYVDYMSRLYEREIKDFFEVAKVKMAGTSKEAKGKFGKQQLFRPTPVQDYSNALLCNELSVRLCLVLVLPSFVSLTQRHMQNLYLLVWHHHSELDGFLTFKTGNIYILGGGKKLHIVVGL